MSIQEHKWSAERLDRLIELFYSRNNLPKSHEDHIVSDDTQIGIEFAFDQINQDKDSLVLKVKELIEFISICDPKINRDAVVRQLKELTKEEIDNE